MIRYTIKRLLQFIPSFILITFLGFLLSDYAPVDPAERLTARTIDAGKPLTGAQRDNMLRDWRHKLGLDLPMFYVSVKSMAECDTLERIPDRGEREMLTKLTEQYGDWQRVSEYYKKVIETEQWLIVERKRIDDTCKAVLADTVGEYYMGTWLGFSHNCESRLNMLDNMIQSASMLKYTWQDSLIEKNIAELNRPKIRWMGFGRLPLAEKLKASYSNLKSNKSTANNYIPSISFHANNRYHQWLFGNGTTTKGVLRGDFGFSYTSGQPVSAILWSRIGYTLLFSLGGIFLAYLISIPLGVYAAVKKNSWFDRVSSLVLFLLYSMPSFWLATLLLMAFANPDVFYWFEASGVKPAQGFPEGANIFQKLWISLPYLVLPMICYTYSSLAFLSRTLRVSVLEQIKQDYITTARAKGLPQGRVVWRHAFRNAWLPLITVLANVFPYAIGGSVILETVFTIPGLGFETYRSIIGQDYPVIMAMLTLTSVLTMVGLLVQDILYAVADPRISLNKIRR